VPVELEHATQIDPAGTEPVTGSPEAGSPYAGLRGHKRWRPYLALVLVDIATWLIAYAFGVRFNFSDLNGPPVSDPWQLLDRHLLKTQLLSSIWHLQSQPPLFNLLSGLLLKLPTSMSRDVGELLFIGCGLVLALSAFQAMLDLTAPRWLAFCVTILLIIAPSNILYQHWYSYEYPTATLLSAAAMCCIRYLKIMKWGWGFGFLMCVAVVVLLNSTYQALWLVIILLVLLVAFRRHWRSVLVVAVLPVILVGGWFLNDLAQFGTLTTSSWLGMNLAEATLASAPPGVVTHLVARGTLTPIADVTPFAPVSAYVPRFAPIPHTGTPALDEPTKSDGNVNYNDLIYVKVSELYLHDDLAFIRAEPGMYARTVAKGVALWFVPGDEYFVIAKNEQRISHWTRLYDGVLLGQISNHEDAALEALFAGRGPGPTQIPWVMIAVWLIACIGAPIAAFRLRKRDVPIAVTLIVLWLTILYAFVTTSLIEFGENERFGFEVGPLPVILAVATGAICLREMRSGTTGPSNGSEPIL
jgi:hypothetical protein